MISRMVIALTLAAALLLPVGCAPAVQTVEPPVNADKAIMIAARDVPIAVLRDAWVSADMRGDEWRIWFYLSPGGGKTVTRDELGWVEGGDTSFSHSGYAPADAFRLITIMVSSITGAVTSRQASDSLISGLVGRETMRASKASVWLPVLVGAAGLVVGGGFVWAVMNRKRSR